MYIYIADNAGALTGPVELPVTPGIGIQVPGNAIQLAKKLGLAASGHIWALVDGQPQQVADQRGTAYNTVTGAAQQHTELGALPAELTSTPRPSADHRWSGTGWALDADLQSANHLALVASLGNKIDMACEATITAGFISDALGYHHRYSSQLDDQLNLTGAILRGLDMPYACRDEQGVKAYREHTAEQLRQVGDDFTLYKLQLLQHALALKDQLDLAHAAGDLKALEAVTWEPAPL
jgi:hypothetical protein